MVGWIGFNAPLIASLAFIPMLLCSIGYSEMNKADPDCGTTFTWATRAFGPKTGWAGGWAIVAADVLVMASLAQVAGQYVFLLVQGPNSAIGTNAASGWVLLVGVLWIVAMTLICYIGIEVSANFQKILLGIEIVMLLVLSITALVKVYGGNHPPRVGPSELSWFLPDEPAAVGLRRRPHPDAVHLLGLGYRRRGQRGDQGQGAYPGPGRDHLDRLLLVTYGRDHLGAQSFSGIGTKGIGLRTRLTACDVLSVLGGSVFGSGGFGSFLSRLLFLMMLSSAAASTQTTILPTARTTLSMAAYKALPDSFAKIHHKFLTPTVSTIAMGVVSIVLYIPMNYISKGNAIVDAVTAIGLYIAFYYGLTAFSCVWYYRKTLHESQRNLWMRGIPPRLGGLIMWSRRDQPCRPTGAIHSYTIWTVPGLNWQIGGIFIIALVAALAGVIVGIYMRITSPPFFRKETLTRATPTLVPDTDA